MLGSVYRMCLKDGHISGQHNMALASQDSRCPVPEEVDSEAVGSDDGAQGEVEGEEGADDDKIAVVDLAELSAREQHILNIQHSQDWDGGGQQQPQAPGQQDLAHQGDLRLRPVLEGSLDACVPGQGRRIG